MCVWDTEETRTSLSACERESNTGAWQHIRPQVGKIGNTPCPHWPYWCLSMVHAQPPTVHPTSSDVEKTWHEHTNSYYFLQMIESILSGCITTWYGSYTGTKLSGIPCPSSVYTVPVSCQQTTGKCLYVSNIRQGLPLNAWMDIFRIRYMLLIHELIDI